jgi:RNA polymerase sigma-70 factor (ECF subfamily)
LACAVQLPMVSSVAMTATDAPYERDARQTPDAGRVPDARGAIDAVWRIESARLIAGLARFTRDVGLAEELAQDALVAALEQWPAAGIPDNPGAWLTATAKNRAIDQARHVRMRARKHAALGAELEMDQRLSAGELEARAGDEIGDDLLRLIFIACHPVLSREARSALTLRLLGGLTTEEIARAFLVPEPTIAQRIVRAKRTLADAHVPFEIPRREELATRLASVLEVIYLIFNEGYSATAGEDWMRPALCEEALRIGRILAELAPAEAEVHGLVALMEIQASRLRARTGPGGEPVLLADQNRAQWDRILIHRGLLALARGEACARSRGAYLLQAAIAASHARAVSAEDTDWVLITALYDGLARVAPSPVVELNRAVAVAMAYGPAAGLVITEELEAQGALRSYHLLPSVRGDLLTRLGRYQEARGEFERAAALTRNAREKRLLLDRAAACAHAGTDATS